MADRAGRKIVFVLSIAGLIMGRVWFLIVCKSDIIISKLHVDFIHAANCLVAEAISIQSFLSAWYGSHQHSTSAEVDYSVQILWYSQWLLIPLLKSRGGVFKFSQNCDPQNAYLH